MRTLRVPCLAVLLVFSTGCFVLEEIDAGMEIMEAHSPAKNKQKREQEQAQTKPGEPAGPTYQQKLGEWWSKAGSLNVSKEEREAAEDPLMACRHAGKTLFTKRSDCLARGGELI